MTKGIKRKAIKTNGTAIFNYGDIYKPATRTKRKISAKIRKERIQNRNENYLTQQMKRFGLIAESNQIVISNIPKKITINERLEEMRNKIKNAERNIGTNNTITEGFVYLVINPAWPNYCKVGSTQDYEVRLTEYQMYDPTANFRFQYIRYVENRLDKERDIQQQLAVKSTKRKGEWFEIDLKLAHEIFKS